MRRITLAALAAALALPVALGAGPSAHADEATTPTASTPATSSTLRAAGAPAAFTPQRLATLRTAAFSLAGSYAGAAPQLSWRQKARNADTLAARMRLPNISTRERAIAIGKTQLGTMYRWGGTTPAGFDCSGFTRYAFGKAGKNLPRTAAQQRRATPAVATPRVGDLVFLGGRTPYHVGIYVGDGKMLHSPRTGKAVQVAPIWSAATYGRV